MNRSRRRKGKATAYSLLILAGTAAAVFVVLFTVVGTAELIQDYRGIPEPRDFDPVLMGSMVLGLVLDLVVIILGIFFAIRFWLRYTQPFGVHLCAKCGYDLRGATEYLPTCPECGFRNEAIRR